MRNNHLGTAPGSKFERWGPLLTIAGALLLWEGCSRTDLITSTFFPAPSTIFAVIMGLLLDGQIATHAGVTLARVLAGFTLGGGAGLILGLAMGASPRLHAQIDPLVALVHPTPKIAALPLILVIFGIGEAPKLVLAALGAFFPILISTVAGVQQIPPTYFEVARSYGAGPLNLFRRVVWPGSLPFLFTGARLAINVALVLTIAAELVVGQSGLGQRTWFAWQTMRIPEVYAWLAVTSVAGATLSFLLGGLAKICMPWEHIRAVKRR